VFLFTRRLLNERRALRPISPLTDRLVCKLESLNTESDGKQDGIWWKLLDAVSVVAILSWLIIIITASFHNNLTDVCEHLKPLCQGFTGSLTEICETVFDNFFCYFLHVFTSSQKFPHHCHQVSSECTCINCWSQFVHLLSAFASVIEVSVMFQCDFSPK